MVAIVEAVVEPLWNFKFPFESLQIVVLPELFAPTLGFVADPLFKTKPVGSINPSTVNLPDINKFTLLLLSAVNSAPDVLGLCAEYIIIFPVPSGAIVILLLPPSSILIEPEFVPLFVLRIKSPVPFVVIVAFVSASPILTVSVSKFTSPVPFGASVILPLVPSVIVIEPVVAFPVCNLTSWSPFDLIIPAAVPSPTERFPLISTSPLEAVTLNLVSPPVEALAPVPLLITKSPLFNTLNCSEPGSPVPFPFTDSELVVKSHATAANPIALEDKAVVHLSPFWFCVPIWLFVFTAMLE